MSTSLLPVGQLSPGHDLGGYIRAVNGISVLSVEEERELAFRLYDEADLEAARRLVLSHLRFVVHIARSYSGYGLPQADLIQEGNVGLMKAVKRFDPNQGVRLYRLRFIGSRLRYTNLYCVTGGLLKSPRRKLSVSCSLTCAAPRSALPG